MYSVPPSLVNQQLLHSHNVLWLPRMLYCPCACHNTLFVLLLSHSCVVVLLNACWLSLSLPYMYDSSDESRRQQVVLFSGFLLVLFLRQFTIHKQSREKSERSSCFWKTICWYMCCCYSQSSVC